MSILRAQDQVREFMLSRGQDPDHVWARDDGKFTVACPCNTARVELAVAA